MWRREHLRTRRRENLRRLRHWKTWIPFAVCLPYVTLSHAIAGHFWPRAHGADYAVTRVILGPAVVGVIVVVVGFPVMVVIGFALDRWRKHWAHDQPDS